MPYFTPLTLATQKVEASAGNAMPPAVVMTVPVVGTPIAVCSAVTAGVAPVTPIAPETTNASPLAGAAIVTFPFGPTANALTAATGREIRTVPPAPADRPKSVIAPPDIMPPGP